MKNILKVRIFFVLIFIFGFSLFIPQTSFAHILKYDGSIGAVLHVNPEDDPIAGEPTGFFFEFKDKNNKFTPENCRCTVTVSTGEKNLYSKGLFEDNPSASLTNASFNFTFPKLDVYTLVVKGESIDGSFDTFTLEYDIRVARNSTNKKLEAEQILVNKFSSSNIFYIGLALIVVVIVFLYFLKNFRNNIR